jgi:hypothetical protein
MTIFLPPRTLRAQKNIATKRHKKPSAFAKASADRRDKLVATGPSTSLRAILSATQADKIGFVWVCFDQVSNVHFSL